MAYQEALQYLDSFINYEKKPDVNYRESVKLSRMERLVEALDNPHLHVKRSIHIAGTKGKGSTAAFVSSILGRHGFRTGLYTSPHLVTLRERIRIGDEPISEEDLARLTEEIKPAAEALKGDLRPSFFEIYTALAFMYFKERNVDFAVYEAGMGGRLDATNVIRPLVAAITPVSYDHAAILGESLGEIASEKAGIIKDGAICVLGPQDREALEAIESAAALRKATIYRVGRDILFEALPSDGLREVFSVSGIFGEYPLVEAGLLGIHQIVNASTAVGIIEALRLFDITVPQDAVREGLRSARWPGRFEIIRRGPTIVLDGAHNRASAEALADTIKRKLSFGKLVLILGISKDKDIKGIIEALEPIANRIILTKAGVAERAEEPSRIRGFIKTKDTLLTENLAQALEEARSSTSPEDAILITGSLFLVGDAKKLLS